MCRFSYVLILPTLWLGAQTRDAMGQPILRYADTLKAYAQGPGAQPGYTTPSAALGQPSTGHTAIAAMNNDTQTGAPLVVSLGQAGSITLGFNTPVRNQPASARNPYGYDLLIWGNCFQGGSAVTPEFEFGRFQEQGFVEVAAADASGHPIEWFLILPRIFHDPKQRAGVPRDFLPADLLPPEIDGDGLFLTSGDLSTSASRFDGFADSVPASGATLANVLSLNTIASITLDNPATYAIEGLGGSGIDLSRAVRQSGPGVPLLVNDAFVFAYPPRIDLIRVTDARADDLNPGAAGPVTTEIDGVIVLPDLRECPTPFADADRDGDVDMDDFGAFQRCSSGTNLFNTSPECACFDRDGDGDADSSAMFGELSDFDRFMLCATRANVPANTGCEP